MLSDSELITLAPAACAATRQGALASDRGEALHERSGSLSRRSTRPALIDLSDEFGKSYSSRSKQDTWLDKKCSSVADKYTGGADLEKMKLIVSWDTRTKASWRAGAYLVNCKVAALLEDKSGLAPVTGSVAKGARDEQKPSTSDKPKTSSKPGR